VPPEVERFAARPIDGESRQRIARRRCCLVGAADATIARAVLGPAHPSKFCLRVVARQSPIAVGINSNRQRQPLEVLGQGLDTALRDKPAAKQNSSHEERDKRENDNELKRTEPPLSSHQASLADRSWRD
jgi:hypothetical protein